MPQLVGQVRGHNPETVKSADQVRKLMLYAGLCTGRQELEPQLSIPTAGSHGKVHHLASVHRSHRALYGLKPYKLYYPEWEYVESHEFCISTLRAEDDTCFSEKTHPFSGTVFFFCYCASAHSPTPLLHTVCGSTAVYSAFLM